MTARLSARTVLSLPLLVAALATPSLAQRPARAAVPTASSIHLVTGTRAAVDADGQRWSPDAPFALGGHLSTTTHPIAGALDQQLFQTYRVGMTGYQVPAVNGTYTLTLNMAEHYWTRPGSRVFSVAVAGRTVASGVDIVAAAGEFHAYQRSFPVTITSGVLDLRFTNAADYAAVASLSLTAATVTPSVAAVSTPESFGAKGNGVTDDTVALQNAFDAATPATPIVLTAGRTYAHSGVLHLRRTGLHLTGSGTLLATAEQTSSLWIEADNVLIDGGLTVTARTTHRWASWEQMGVRLVGHRGITLRNITVRNSAAAGVYVGGSAGFVLDHVTVRDTRADGIHMTMGSNGGQVVTPTIINTGDDGVAVVSYAADGAPCANIVVTSPRVLGTTNGRGLSVVGGTHITETDVDLHDTSGAGIYIAAEGNPWFTAAPQSVSFTGGSIVGANTSTTVDHGAVLVLAGENNVVPSHIAVSNIAITGTRATSSRDFGVITYGSAPADVLFQNLTISGGPRNAYEGNTPQTSYRLRNVVKNGADVPDRG